MKKYIYNLIYKILYFILPKNDCDTFIYDSYKMNESLLEEFDNSFYTNAFTLFDLKQIRALKSSNIVIIDNYYHPLSIINKKNQVVYQLWHANGAIKSFGLTKANLDEKQRSIELKQYSNYDYVLSPSKKATEIYINSFGINKEQILKFGYIQMDKYLNYVKPKNEVIHVFYAPTFRKNNDYTKQIELVNRLKKFPNVKFSYNLHPLSGIKSDFNTNEELEKCDIFISDYSSLILEAMYLQKAVYLYQYDKDDYALNEGLAMDKLKLPNSNELDFKNLIYSSKKFNEYNKLNTKELLINHIKKERKKL